MTYRRTTLALIPVLVSLCTTVPALAAPDKRELQARENFAAGRYQDALDLFAKLYAEKLHPNYLRNIGRCYQNLGDADKAITSFRDYLRKAKGISDEERAEVDGYIKEMEELSARRRGQAAVAPEPQRTPPATPSPPPPASPPSATAAPILIDTPAPPSSDESSPVYKRWWFWTIIGAVALTGAGLAAAGVFTSAKDAPCDAGRICL